MGGKERRKGSRGRDPLICERRGTKGREERERRAPGRGGRERPKNGTSVQSVQAPPLPATRPLEAPGGQLRGQRRLGLGPGLPCLSLASVPVPQGSPICTCLPVEQGGRGGWSDGLVTRGQDGRMGRACGEGSGSVGQWPPGKPSGVPGGWVVPPPPWQGRSEVVSSKNGPQNGLGLPIYPRFRCWYWIL